MTLENFKKSNKVRREAIANKAGMSVEEYIKTLSTDKVYETKKILTKKDKVISTKKVIHNVVLLDSSGSMRGAKYNNSINGITAELESVKSNNETTIYNYLYDFLDYSRVLVERYSKQESPEFNFRRLDPAGNFTPLYTSLFTLLTKLSDIPESEKVLVKVYTDGENNGSWDKQIPCAALIKFLSKKNFTITFVATENDMRNIVRDLQLDDSNTLTVSNTGDGFKKAFDKSLIATKDYVTKVENNEEVSSGFYKSVGKL